MSLSHLSEESLNSRFKEVMRRIDALEVRLAKMLEARNERKIEQSAERINDKLDAVLELLNLRQGTTGPDNQTQPEQAGLPHSKNSSG